ncbi:MAG: Dabb family protein [Cyanothece sp. SIO1E1]|nr:Dabb family protein [Cyanothece sp. SIO1E1]
MINHVVLWKLKEEAEGNTKAVNAEKMKELLEAMPPLIEALDSVKVRLHMFDDRDDATCDIALIARCKDEEDLKAYAAHPEHQKVVSFIKKVVSERRVIDFVN